MRDFFQRINYKGKIDDISLAICKDFQIGDLVSNKLVLVGYEDFNFILKTTNGKYFVKIFSNFRSDDDCDRYIEIMLNTIKAGVSFPRLFKYQQNYLYTKTINSSKLRICVMEYIDGESYYSLKQKPDIDEIKILAHQAGLINSIEIKPKFIYDEWAIINFLNEFQKKGKYLLQQDFIIMESLVKKFKDLSIEKLPHCFVHGDIIVTNTMKDGNGKIWIIDFAVSNYYPRIQELAVLACNVLFDEKDDSKSKNNLKIALEEYQRTIILTPRELEVLPDYIKLAHAMHLLSGNYEKIIKKNDLEENEYWLNQGRAGLLSSKL